MNINVAGILILNNTSEILVLHRKPSVPEGNRWGLPAGKVLEGGQPIDTAILKTVQEVSLKFQKNQLKHLGEFRFEAVGNNITMNVWVVRLNEDQDSKIKLNYDGHDSYKWQKPESLLEEKDIMVGMYPILRKFLQERK